MSGVEEERLGCRLAKKKKLDSGQDSSQPKKRKGAGGKPNTPACTLYMILFLRHACQRMASSVDVDGRRFAQDGIACCSRPVAKQFTRVEGMERGGSVMRSVDKKVDMGVGVYTPALAKRSEKR